MIVSIIIVVAVVAIMLLAIIIILKANAAIRVNLRSTFIHNNWQLNTICKIWYRRDTIGSWQLDTTWVYNVPHATLIRRCYLNITLRDIDPHAVYWLKLFLSKKTRFRVRSFN